jgi:hypothetical protein
LEANGHAHAIQYTYDRLRQAVMAERDRPIALREACAPAGASRHTSLVTPRVIVILVSNLVVFFKLRRGLLYNQRHAHIPLAIPVFSFYKCDPPLKPMMLYGTDYWLD